MNTLIGKEEVSTPEKLFVGHVRVSSRKQKASGLGEEDQLIAIKQYVNNVGGKLIRIFIEHDSGGDKGMSIHKSVSLEQILSARPTLNESIETSKTYGATLIVKKYCRLSRFSLLMDFLLAHKVDFICSDSPNDDPIIIKLRTAINEENRLEISRNTIATLALVKKNGSKSGKPVGNPYFYKMKDFTQAQLREFDDEYRRRLKAPVPRYPRNLNGMRDIAEANPVNQRNMAMLHSTKLAHSDWSYTTIAIYLNDNGYRTSNGLLFTRNSARSLYLRRNKMIARLDYEKAEELHTVAGYREFMKRHPKSCYYHIARNTISVCYAKEREEEQNESNRI